MSQYYLYKGGSLRFSDGFMTEEKIKNIYTEYANGDPHVYRYAENGKVREFSNLKIIARNHNLIPENYNTELDLLDAVNNAEKFINEQDFFNKDDISYILSTVVKSLLNQDLLKNINYTTLAIYVQCSLINFEDVPENLKEDVKNELLMRRLDFLVPLEYKQNTVNENVEKVA